MTGLPGILDALSASPLQLASGPAGGRGEALLQYLPGSLLLDGLVAYRYLSLLGMRQPVSFTETASMTMRGYFRPRIIY
jgi:hypothetical protein